MNLFAQIYQRLKKKPESEVTSEDSESNEVQGDRGLPSLKKSRSVESRMTNMIVIGMILIIGTVGLWRYYSVRYSKAQAEKAAEGPVHTKSAGSTTIAPFQEPPPPPPEIAEAPIPVVANNGHKTASNHAMPPPAQQFGPDGKPILSPAEQEKLNRLNSPVKFKGQTGVSNAVDYAKGVGAPVQTEGSTSTLGSALQATFTPGVKAFLLPDRDYVIAPGKFIKCTLQTAIASSTVGMVKCIQQEDVYSDSGRVVLLERGTEYNGEYRAQLAPGQSSLFILWREAKTPLGVIVELASPATDTLGRAGVAGTLDTHFWERFNAAFLFSAIQTGSEVIANKAASSGTNIYTGSSGSGSLNSVLADVVKPGLQISNSITKNQGETVGIYVARVLDFRNVYALRNSR